MNDLQALAAAGAEYRRRLDATADGQWTAPTRCGSWDVAALTDHVSGGNQMSVALLAGADAATALAEVTAPSTDDPQARFDATCAAQLAAFQADGALTMTVHHPSLDMPGDTLLMFRTLDLAVHGWDLATSLGLDTSLDPDLVASLWRRLEPFAPLLAASGMFGTPEGDAPADATPQQRLLHATGR
jgi:uncharacterized protein (TIGR03086 family)